MRTLFAAVATLVLTTPVYAQQQQQPTCQAPEYRAFDFWIGEWDVYAKTGAKAGDSKISLILDSCIILEEWTSAGSNQGIRFAGKSFNTWNRNTKQWQQTWVDNTGGSIEYLEGKYDDQKISEVVLALLGVFEFENGRVWKRLEENEKIAITTMGR